MIGNNFLSKLIFGACCSALVLFPGAASSQVSVSPLIIEAQAKRGQAQGMITLTNTSNSPSRVRVYAQPFTYTRNEGFQILEESESNLSPYLQFSPRELTIKPGESRRVRLISRLAPSLADGEYRAVVFNETLNETKDADGNNVTLVARIGVTFYVRKGNVSSKLAVDNASFNKQAKQIQLLVRNDGKATAISGVNWTLKRGGNTIKSGKLDSNSIIAQSDRNLLLDFPGQEKLTPGNYELSGELVWGDDDNKTKQPFKMNVNIPTVTAASQKK